MTGPKKKHLNDEREVHCPVEGCDETPLARGVHLHVIRSVGDGHGEQGEVPHGVDLDDLEPSGTREVQMEYPEHRETEKVMRLCPYCGLPFHGKHGVLIHLGQTAGRKNHPEELPENFDPDSLTIVQVDEHDNIVEVVEEGVELPTVERRQQSDQDEKLPERVIEYLAQLREEGRDDEADRAEEMLLS